MTAAILIRLAELWLYFGATAAAFFLTIGIDRIDEDARGAYIFRPLLIPGVLLIWPLVLWRWYLLETARNDTMRHYRPPRYAHAGFWLILGILIPVIFATSLSVRQTEPNAIAPQRLALPDEARQ
jgi:hypothetical protein